MTVDEISSLAAIGSEMPDRLNSAEQRLFQSLRLLYAQYRMGSVSPEQGKREKAKIVKAFEVDTLRIQIDRRCMDINLRLGHLLNEKSNCETCKRVARILDGREKT